MPQRIFKNLFNFCCRYFSAPKVEFFFQNIHPHRFFSFSWLVTSDNVSIYSTSESFIENFKFSESAQETRVSIPDSRSCSWRTGLNEIKSNRNIPPTTRTKKTGASRFEQSKKEFGKLTLKASHMTRMPTHLHRPRPEPEPRRGSPDNDRKHFMIQL